MGWPLVEWILRAPWPSGHEDETDNFWQINDQDSSNELDKDLGRTLRFGFDPSIAVFEGWNQVPPEESKQQNFLDCFDMKIVGVP